MSLKGKLAALARRRALESGKMATLWRRLERPSMADWAEYLRRHGRFHHIGQGCHFDPDNVLIDPHMISIGNRVMLAGVFMACHDGSVTVMNEMSGTRMDAVGPIIIGDDVFIGRGATILPNTRIGARCIIGAGSVVGGTWPSDSVIAGNPARHIRPIQEHVEILRGRNQSYPWLPLIEQRTGGYDARIEPELRRQRIAHFFGDGNGQDQVN